MVMRPAGTTAMGGSVATQPHTLSPKEFEWIRAFLYERTGISLRDGKEALVVGRLDKRLRQRGLDSFSEYFRLIKDDADPVETRTAIDLLTTNETFFFREQPHFDLLRDIVSAHRDMGAGFRVWSAASSTGEEAYSIAMTIANAYASPRWEVVGTDISSRVVETAKRGLYPLDATRQIPQDYLRAYCLKGKGEFDGFLSVSPEIRSHVTFTHANLMDSLARLGTFDVIFLRNVMIYFDIDTKRALLERVSSMLNPGGYLMVSHSESINGIQGALRTVSPSVFRAAERGSD
jgi:chemotaxis protein methyltransferase CheR